MNKENRKEARQECFWEVRVNSENDYLADISSNGARLVAFGPLTRSHIKLMKPCGQEHLCRVAWSRNMAGGWTEAGLDFNSQEEEDVSMMFLPNSKPWLELCKTSATSSARI